VSLKALPRQLNIALKNHCLINCSGGGNSKISSTLGELASHKQWSRQMLQHHQKDTLQIYKASEKSENNKSSSVL
jgi:hypothetical protein